MGSERAALGTLSRIFSGALSAPGGIQEFVRTLNLDHLAGRTVQDVYVALVDYIFPPNGDMDDAYARDAYLEAVAEFDCSGIEHPDATTSREFIAAFLAHAIHIRTINAIANGIVVMPTDVELANAISAGLMGFIRGGVTDAIAGIDVLQADQFQSQIDDLCERAVSFIEGDADAAAGERQ